MKPYTLFINEDYKKLDWRSSGSNPVYKVEDEEETDREGRPHYIIKDYDGDSHRENVEIVASRIYEALGAKTTNPQLKNILMKTNDGKKIEIKGLFSEFQEDLHPLTVEAALALPMNKKIEIANHFIASVLVRNHDVVGFSFDNLMYNKKTKNIYHVDAGGAFDMRAQGEIKSGLKNKTSDREDNAHPFPREPEELESMVFSGKGASKLFFPLLRDLLLNKSGQGSNALESAGKKLKSVSDSTLRSIVIDGGLSEDFANRLVERKKRILDRLPDLIKKIKE